MNERNLIPEAIEYLSKSDEERILYCKKDHWIGYGAAVKLIEILEDKFLDPPQMRHEGLLIYGDSNNGKTAILKRMYELHKTKLDYVTKDGEAIYEIPIIYFQAPTIPDENRLYNLILERYGRRNQEDTSDTRGNRKRSTGSGHESSTGTGASLVWQRTRI